MSLSSPLPSPAFCPHNIYPPVSVILFTRPVIMADRLWRILGLSKKKEGEGGGVAGEEPVECVVVEKTGSLSNIKQTFLHKCKPGRKRSRSETCLQPRAPLCGGESNISLYSLHSLHRKHQHPTTSSQSMLGIDITVHWVTINPINNCIFSWHSKEK